MIGIDIETRKEAFRIEGASAPHVVKYGPDGKHIYVTCKKITGIAILDPTARELVKFHQTNVNPRSLTFSPDEKNIYFASYWVDGFFEMEVESGKVTRLLAMEPPANDREPREVTYHGVEAVGERLVLGANEGRGLVDAVDVQSGHLIDRLKEVSQPCCIETIPGISGDVVRVLVSNIGDGTLARIAIEALLAAGRRRAANTSATTATTYSPTCADHTAWLYASNTPRNSSRENGIDSEAKAASGACDRNPCAASTP